MVILGIDPDTNNTGWALVEETPEKVRVLECGVVDTRKTSGILGVERTVLGLLEILPTLPQADGVVAEYPQHYHKGSGRPSRVDPNSLIMLSAISGAAVAIAKVREGGPRALVRPAVWKGQQSKGANQRQSCRVVGWTFGVTTKYTQALHNPVPDKDVKVHGWSGRSGKPWSEILDAVGLAVYGLGKFRGHLV